MGRWDSNLFDLQNYGLVLVIGGQVSNNILKLWPEIDWIKDKDLSVKVANAWEYAIKKSILSEDKLLL